MKPFAANNIKKSCSILVMLAALAWLTISLPYVNGAQMHLKAKEAQSEEKKGGINDNPLTNTIAEKNESGPVSLSEYLHEEQSAAAPELALMNFYKCHPSDLYYAFHPELISPPPEAVS